VQDALQVFQVCPATTVYLVTLAVFGQYAGRGNKLHSRLLGKNLSNIYETIVQFCRENITIRIAENNVHIDKILCSSDSLLENRVGINLRGRYILSEIQFQDERCSIREE
jgi:hypothetical protein